MNLSDTITAADLIRATQRCARVALLSAHGDVLYGHARRVSGDLAAEVEDCSLEVTLDYGGDVAYAMPDVIAWHQHHELVLDPDPS